MGVAQVSASIYWYASSSYSTDPFVSWIMSVADESDPPQANSISWGAVENVFYKTHYVSVKKKLLVSFLCRYILNR